MRGLEPGWKFSTSIDPATGALRVNSLNDGRVLVTGNLAGLLTVQGGGEARGTATLKLAKGGKFTGLVNVGGKSTPFKGTQAADGSIAATVTPRGGASIIVALAPVGANGDREYTGTVTRTDNGVTTVFDATLLRLDKRPKLAPSEYAGAYTMLIEPGDTPPSGSPGGSGYALVTVKPSGAASAKGVLADGTKFSHGLTALSEGRWPFFVSLYTTKPKGHLSGLLTFREVADVSDFDGTLDWKRPLQTKPGPFQTGFTVSRSAIGSRYTRPLSGERALPSLANTTDNVVLDLVTSGVGPFTLTLDTRNKLLFSGPEKISGSIAPKTGLLGGKTSRKDPAFAAKFRGVVFQKQFTAGGIWVSGDATGTFTLAAP